MRPGAEADSIYLSALEFDVLCEAAGFEDRRHIILDVPSPGTTYTERADLVAQAWESLRHKRLAEAKRDRVEVELADLLGLDPGTATPLVQRLVKAGLVEKHRPHDERSVVIELTPQGRALRERAEHVPHVMVRRLGLEMAEVEQLRASMHRLITAAAQAGPPTEEELAALAGRAGGRRAAG